MKPKQIMFLLFILILLFAHCDLTESPANGSLTLSLEEVSCTEAWLTLKSTNLQIPNSITLSQNGQARMTVNITTADTLLYVDSLLPNQSYKFETLIPSVSHSLIQPIKSNELNVTTLDTTSHNFTWQTWTFGEHSSSILYDVAIINENNIWAVGEIYINDSLGQPDPNAYNAVHWDGSKWEIKKISVLFRGSLITPTMYSVFAFSPTEIWMSSGVPVKGDGNTWTQYHLFDMGILTQQDGYLTNIWGSSSNDIYFVGTLGTIAHWDGVKWTKIESGTTTNINDVWGDYNEKAGEWEILAVASNILQSYDKEIILLNSNYPELISKDGIEGTLSSVWFKSFRNYYVAGSGIYKKNSLVKSQWQGNPWDITTYFIYKLRGNKMNDIVAAGGFGEVLHFNGFSWKSYFYNAGLGYGNYYSIAYKNDIVAICGFDNRQGVITLGKHQ
jgi:hypothetical protein